MNEYVEHNKIATSLNPSEGGTYQRGIKVRFHKSVNIV